MKRYIFKTPSLRIVPFLLVISSALHNSQKNVTLEHCLVFKYLPAYLTSHTVPDCEKLLENTINYFVVTLDITY